MLARRSLAAVLAAGTLVAAGCGTQSNDVSSADFKQPEQKAVATAVKDFSNAAGKRDYKAICSEQLAASLVRQLDAALKQGKCPERLKQSLRDVSATDLAVRAVAVTGTNALVTVQTTGTGNAEPAQRLKFAKEGSRWKLAGLA
jgi:hypothetical protein